MKFTKMLTCNEVFMGTTFFSGMLGKEFKIRSQYYKRGDLLQCVRYSPELRVRTLSCDSFRLVPLPIPPEKSVTKVTR
jgi:hypothetical protein